MAYKKGRIPPELKPPYLARLQKPRIDKQHLPKFTYGLEGKLTSLIGEPIVLAQRVVRPKFENEMSATEGPGCVRYTYHTEKHIREVDSVCQTYPFLWKEQQNIFTTTSHILHRDYNFRVELFEDSEGKLRSFNFALQVK